MYHKAAVELAADSQLAAKIGVNLRHLASIHPRKDMLFSELLTFTRSQSECDKRTAYLEILKQMLKTTRPPNPSFHPMLLKAAWTQMICLMEKKGEPVAVKYLAAKNIGWLSAHAVPVESANLQLALKEACLAGENVPDAEEILNALLIILEIYLRNQDPQLHQVPALDQLVLKHWGKLAPAQVSVILAIIEKIKLRKTPITSQF